MFKLLQEILSRYLFKIPPRSGLDLFWFYLNPLHSSHIKIVELWYNHVYVAKRNKTIDDRSKLK